MFSATRLLGGLLNQGLGRSTPSLGGGLLGTAAKVAGVAAVGGAAYAAYRHYQAGGFGRGGPGLFGGAPEAPGAASGAGFAGATTAGGGPGWTDAAGAGFGGNAGGWASQPSAPAAAPAPAPTGRSAAPPAQPTSAEEEEALLLVRAMIAAAQIDGQIDAAEQQRIVEGAAHAGFGPAEQQALQRELASPQPPNVLLGQVRGPDLGAQFYLVTLLAVDLDNDAEKTYVRALPLVLQLPPEKVAEIHQQLGVPRP
ncbi:MAG: tellurite resistance TerB family protein [Myxococcales bacterium]|nr:tellurite resistance TerB family protein [Myxococcales bacterium]